MKDLIAHTEFQDFRAKSMPETPFGRDAHEALGLFYDVGQLEAIYDQTDTLLSLLRELKDEPARLALITHHLKRLPRLPGHPGQGRQIFDEIEIFQVKKFLNNYRALMEQLPTKARLAFGFEYRSRPLEGRLNQGGQSAETFYIADEYSPELASVRAEILKTDAQMQALESKRADEIKGQFGFDFQGQPFLLVPKESLAGYSRSTLKKLNRTECVGCAESAESRRKAVNETENADVTLIMQDVFQVESLYKSASRLLVIEPYDDSLLSVRPLKCAAALALEEKRLELAQRERVHEETVLETISKEIQAETPDLLKYRDTALAFDLAWGRARMASELGLTRPRLHTKNSIHISKGRFAPCESICAKHGVPYTPLDAVFESGATVIFGSNMGGKTVVLQTAALLQLAAQAGLFVPARSFETRIFHAFHYIGERRGGYIHGGLSGFGAEMRQLTEAWRSVGADETGTLLLMDEFAHTTTSNEAEAILAAVLEAISQKTNTIALCSTHFHGLPRLPNIRFLRMAGLEQKNIPTGLSEDPIREIARRMTYRLMPDDGKQGSDAIAVARMLGLDMELVQRAVLLFNK